MCQILFSREKNPPAEALKFGNSMNKDGFGFAFVAGGKVKWEKGFLSQDLTDEMIQKYMDLPFPKAIHFRLATHGGTSKELTHPFPIKRGVPLALGGEAESVLFHNGVWSDWDDRIRDGIIAGTINPNYLKEHMSDSRAIAILAQRFGVDFLDVLSLGSNKVLVLSGKTWYRYGSWTEKDGWAASNSRIEPSIIQGVQGGKHEMGTWTHDKKDKRWRYRERGAPSQKSMYLDASRDEIEDLENEWRRRFNG